MTRILLSILCALLLCLAAQPCQAGEPAFSIGVRGGLLSFTGGSSWSLDGMDLKMDNTLTYGISGSYRFTPYFSIEATLEQYRDADGDVNSLSAGSPNVSNIAQTFITLSPKLYWPTGTRMTPYFGAGLSYCFNEFERESYFRDTFSYMELKDSWGWQASVGAYVLSTSSLVFSLDIRYQWTEPTFKWTRRADHRTGEDLFTLAGIMTSVEIKYLF